MEKSNSSMPKNLAQETEVYPWDIPPEALAKAALYEQQGNIPSFLCQCNEALHTVKRPDAVGAGAKAQFRVYPDMVGVSGREPTCLERILMILLWPIAMLLSGWMSILGLAIVCVVVIVIIANPLSLIVVIPLAAVYLAVKFLLKQMLKSLFAKIAAWIRANPKSPWAIRLLHIWTPLFPRYWRRGEAAQIVRVDVSRFLCGSRSLILIAHPEPIPAKPGCLDAILGWIFPKRRVFFMWFDKGKAEADQAAQSAAAVLGLTVKQAEFRKGGRLRIL